MGVFGGLKRIKDNSKKKGVKARKQDKKRLEAQIRQARYDGLSYSQKLELIASRPGNSQREIDRLAKAQKGKTK